MRERETAREKYRARSRAIRTYYLVQCTKIFSWRKGASVHGWFDCQTYTSNNIEKDRERAREGDRYTYRERGREHGLMLAYFTKILCSRDTCQP